VEPRWSSLRSILPDWKGDVDPDQILGKDLSGGPLDGILVPGGFGQRGIDGMVKAAQWARTHGVPYFGICLGMQIMVIEWARNVLGWAGADSTEFNQETKHPVVSLLEEQIDVKNYGGTMRLGRSETVAVEGSKLMAAYGEAHIFERHRHRYEFANVYRKEMVESSLKLGGFTPDGSLVECVEWPDHIWGVGVQFHPEFTSKPIKPQPLLQGFCLRCKRVQSQGAAISFMNILSNICRWRWSLWYMSDCFLCLFPVIMDIALLFL